MCGVCLVCRGVYMIGAMLEEGHRVRPGLPELLVLQWALQHFCGKRHSLLSGDTIRKEESMGVLC